MLLWFVIFVSMASTTILGLWWNRHWEQRKYDMSHVTYKLIFPEHTRQQATNAVSTLSGLRKFIQIQGLHSSRTIVWEIINNGQELAFYLSFPEGLTAAVQDMLMATIPGIGFEPSDHKYNRPWSLAIELRAQLPLLDDEGKPKQLDDTKIPALLTSLAHMEEGEAGIIQFVLKPVGHGDQFHVAARMAVRTANEIRSKQLIEKIMAAYGHLQVFKFRYINNAAVIQERRSPVEHWPMTIHATDLAVVMCFPIGTMQIPGLRFNSGRRLIVEASIPHKGIQVGVSSFPGAVRHVALAEEALDTHVWAFGPTGTGKSVLIRNIANQWVKNPKNGLVMIEAGEDGSNDFIDSLPPERADDLVWFSPYDQVERPVGFNALAGEGHDQIASNGVAMFKEQWGDSWGPRLEMILRNSLLTGSMNDRTLYEVKQLLVNPDFRREELRMISDHDLKQFWRGYTKEDKQPEFDSVINKLDGFVGPSLVRHILGQTGGLNLSDVVTQGKILVVALPPAKLGLQTSSAFGYLILWQLWQEMRRRNARIPTMVVLDEFQNFVGRDGGVLAEMLAEGRKYKMPLILANQESSKLSASILRSVNTNARTKFAFRLSPEEGRMMAPHFAPMSAAALSGMANYEAAVTMMTPTGPAATATITTNEPPRVTGIGDIARSESNRKYGRPVDEVKAELASRHRSDDEPPPATKGRRDVLS